MAMQLQKAVLDAGIVTRDLGRAEERAKPERR